MNNNYKKMQKFLDILREYAISNPKREINKDFVYSFLIRFEDISLSMLSTDVVKQNCYEEWKTRYKNLSNLTVNDNIQGDFCWFLNTYNVRNAIKLYIPMRLEYIKEGANQLFDFILSTNMEHQSKIASSIRNDNVVIRVNSLEDAEKIINYVSSNSYIKEGMLSVNPFLPNLNGIGLTMDNSFSFNTELSNLLSAFIEYLKKENRLDLVTVEQFNRFIKFQIDYTYDLDLKDIYVLLSKTTSNDFKLETFIEHVSNKLINAYDQSGKRIVNSEYYLEKAIIITERYRSGNSEGALLAYLKGNPNYFTRKENARAGLVKYIKPRDLIPLMRKKLQQNGHLIPSNDIELIRQYLNIVLTNQKETVVSGQKKYVDEFEIIKMAYISTLNVYNIDQANEAFRRLYLDNNPEYFTNSFGDRSKLKSLISSSDIKKVILSNINLGEIDINNVNDILNRFIDSISQNVNQKEI